MNAVEQKPCILVIDDTPENLSLMSELLREDYQVKLAPSGERGLQIAAAEPQPDLILLDIMMPGMDGYQVMQQLQADKATRDVPVIFLTALAGVDDERRGLDLGAVDYITKPISPSIALARVRNHLQLKMVRDFMRYRNEYLNREVARRTRQLSALQDVTIRAMASLAETRDNETGSHIRRTQTYVKLLAEQLRDHPRFRDFCTPANIDILFKSAPLHDIGKVGIPDHVLLKPGKLTPDEFEIIKQHPRIGRDAIARALADLGDEDAQFLQVAQDIAYGHHEKWDGSGYPQGAWGDAIPLPARLMALADVYDALISRRVYKPALPHQDAVAMIAQGRGTHFDPDVTDAFLAIQEAFEQVARQFADGDGEALREAVRMHAAIGTEADEL
jgi:putative two-component system response regulator